MTAYEKLRTFLVGLFRLHRLDPDFGIYRIAQARSQEITDFIENGLLAEVKAALYPNGNADPGIEDDATSEVDLAKIHKEVFNHVYSFFRRYYHDGDFLTKGACKPAIAAIPSDCQEMKLHWANHDQYYVKTARNTSDHFIHKDLAGSLTRELDNYIKSEVLHLDDLVGARREQHISKIAAIGRIAGKIIAYLADTEEVQKKLWLKKKFVVETNYCLTLDRVPLHLYPEIAANNGQREEWVRLCAIDEIKEPPEYSAPLTLDFLKGHPFLVIDTKFFPEEFKEALLGEMEDLSDSCNGLIICGEASHALRLIQKNYRGRIDSIVIDPPYNTGSNGFGYKDKYQRSSWLTMMADCLSGCPELLKKDGIFAATIDDNELYHFGLLLNSVFGENNRAACAPWLSEPSRGKEKTGLRTGHEYVLIYHNGDPSAISQDERSTGKLNLHDKFGPYRKGRELRKWGGISSRRDRPNQWYGLKAPDGEEVYPIKNDGTEGHWRWGKNNEFVKAALEDHDVFHWEKCSFDKRVTHLGKSERWVPFEKIRTTRKSVGWSTWLDAYGSNADGTRELKNLFGNKVFDTPKPTQLYKWILSLHSNHDGYVLDFFGGSGTTAHAVIDLNQEDGGKRKYVLVEMEDHFDRVLKPRIQRTVYSKDWKGGKPVSRAGGVSHMFKYLRIESYEDCLNNLEVGPDRARQEVQGADARKGGAVLTYLLDGKNLRNSPLLSINKFVDPASYKLRVKEQGSSELGETTVDLPETFNYLIGLNISAVTSRRWFNAVFEPDSRGRLAMKGGLREDANGRWWFHSVMGTSPDGQRTLVIWRKLTDSEEEDNLVLNQWFRMQGYATEADGFQSIYVNSRNNLEDLKMCDDAGRVHLIEAEFHRLLWDMHE